MTARRLRILILIVAMLIAGNWKMNTDASSAVRLAEDVATRVGNRKRPSMVVCPPHVCLHAVHHALKGSSVGLGAQNMHHAEGGAYTGETAAAMLVSAGCTHVILGHSERRQYFSETDRDVNAKVRQALRHGLIPIVCVGESLRERRAGSERDVVRRQIVGAMEGVTLRSADDIVVAYEPVWAIGTGETAMPQQAQDMHAFILDQLGEHFEPEIGHRILVLYGGSMKPDNARALLRQPDVDGGLIGGASLDGESFAAIVEACTEA